MVAIKVGMWAEACPGWLPPLGKECEWPLARYSVLKTHESELKNWMPKHLKKKPYVGVGLRAGEDLHWSEKPVWSAGDTG